eukprot:7276807-Lingulodinium_polyedra.AAC.1
MQRMLRCMYGAASACCAACARAACARVACARAACACVRACVHACCTLHACVHDARVVPARTRHVRARQCDAACVMLQHRGSAGAGMGPDIRHSAGVRAGGIRAARHA